MCLERPLSTHSCFCMFMPVLSSRSSSLPSLLLEARPQNLRPEVLSSVTKPFLLCFFSCMIDIWNFLLSLSSQHKLPRVRVCGLYVISSSTASSKVPSVHLNVQLMFAESIQKLIKIYLSVLQMCFGYVLLLFVSMKYSWFTTFCYFQMYSKVIHLNRYIFFQNIFSDRQLQDIGYSYLCYTLNLFCLSVSFMVVCFYWSHSLNLYALSFPLW